MGLRRMVKSVVKNTVKGNVNPKKILEQKKKGAAYGAAGPEAATNFAVKKAFKRRQAKHNTGNTGGSMRVVMNRYKAGSAGE